MCFAGVQCKDTCNSHLHSRVFLHQVYLLTVYNVVLVSS